LGNLTLDFVCGFVVFVIVISKIHYFCVYRSIVYNIIKYKTMTKSGDLLLVDFFQQNDVLYTVQTSS